MMKLKALKGAVILHMVLIVLASIPHSALSHDIEEIADASTSNGKTVEVAYCVLIYDTILHTANVDIDLCSLGTTIRVPKDTVLLIDGEAIIGPLPPLKPVKISVLVNGEKIWTKRVGVGLIFKALTPQVTVPVYATFLVSSEGDYSIEVRIEGASATATDKKVIHVVIDEDAPPLASGEIQLKYTIGRKGKDEASASINLPQNPIKVRGGEAILISGSATVDNTAMENREILFNVAVLSPVGDGGWMSFINKKELVFINFFKRGYQMPMNLHFSAPANEGTYEFMIWAEVFKGDKSVGSVDYKILTVIVNNSTAPPNINNNLQPSMETSRAPNMQSNSLINPSYSPVTTNQLITKLFEVINEQMSGECNGTSRAPSTMPTIQPSPYTSSTEEMNSSFSNSEETNNC